MKTELSFSLVGYRKLIQLIFELGWEFVEYPDLEFPLNTKRSLLLRHDIDAELCVLEPFLEIERLAGVTATYFVMLESPLYNVYSPEGRKAIEKITEAGQSVGLHFFAEIHREQTASELISLIEEQCHSLATLVGKEIKTFSFHQPTPSMLQMNISPPGMINTYHPKVMNTFKYLSDTNMNWRSNDPLEVLSRQDAGVQMLVHPIWWMVDGDTPVDRWRNLLKLLNRINANHLLERERTLADVPLASLISDI